MIVQDVQYIYEFDMAEGVSTFENGKFNQSLSVRLRLEGAI